MAAALKLFRYTKTVLALGACLGSGRRPRSASRTHKQRHRSKSCDSSSPSRSGSSRNRAARSRISVESWTRRAAWYSRHATSWRDAREAAHGVGAAAVEERLARMEQDVHRFPELAEQAVTAGEFPGSMRIPGSDTALRIGGLSACVGQQLRPHRHGRQVRHLLDPGRGKRGRKQGRPHDLHGRAQPLQLRPAHADGRRRHARVHRGRLRSAGRRQPVPAPSRLRPVAQAHGRADLVDLLRSRSRAERDRPRGPECDLALPAGAVPLDDPVGGAAGARPLRREPGPQHQRVGRQPVQAVNQVPDLVTRLRWTPGEKTLVHGGLGNWRQPA